MQNKHQKNLISNQHSSSGKRMLELYKAITEKPVSINDFFMIIEEKGDILFKKEILWKYINTLRLFGLDIVKNKNKYHINYILDTNDYTESDLSILKFIEDYAQKNNLKSIKTIIKNILPKIEKSFSQKTINLINSKEIKSYKISSSLSEEELTIRRYEKYCQDKLQLNIKYKTPDKNEQTYKISPLKIIIKNNNAVLIAYDSQNCEYKEFLLNFISYVKQTPQKNSGNYSSSVIYKLKGRLAKSYILKNEESLLEYGKNYIIVSNTKEDKTLLLRRLLRYYDKCEVIYPIKMRNKMTKLIEDIEKIYE